MADDGYNNSAGNDIVELEAMRTDSFSWHPCQVSLCSRGSGLIVLYGNNNVEEMITDKEEVLARIRIRSTPLHGDDCSSIKQGQHVIATKNSRVNSAFYDARVEEAIHVRHSKRIHCRCSFRIKWLHQAFEEEASTVSSSSIMKLATKSIHLHPTISTFFSMLESSNGLHTTPCSINVDGLHSEMDINVLLEKQIQEISNSTDISRDIISPDFIVRQEVGFKGQCHSRIIDDSLKDPHLTFPLLNKLKGLNGSENKQPTKTTVEIPPVCISSIEGEFTGSRFLTPLAARAALASLRSEFPQSPQFSAQSDVEKVAVDRSSNTEEFSLNISTALEGKSPEFKSIVKTLFPTSSASQKVEFSNLSSGAQKNKKTGELKITQPSNSRFTRSQARKDNGVDKDTQMTTTIETQSRLTKSRRVTCSTVDGAEKINAETSECSERGDENLFQEDVVVVKVDVQKGTLVQNAEQNYPKRLTHSAAREETSKNVQPKRELRKRSSGESNELDLYKGIDIVESNGEEAEKSHTSPLKKNRKRSTPKSSENGVSNRLRFLPRTRSQCKA